MRASTRVTEAQEAAIIQEIEDTCESLRESLEVPYSAILEVIVNRFSPYLRIKG